MDAQGHFDLSEGVQLHMFISQPPCGNACVIGSDQQAVRTLPTKIWMSSADAVNLQQDQLINQDAHSKCSFQNKLYLGEGSAYMPAISAGNDMPAFSKENGQLDRLGGKSATQDSRSTQQEQQLSKNTQQEQQSTIAPLKDEGVGGLCRKPGRGDTTLSMSCSDKLARWALLGVQVACSPVTASKYVADNVFLQCWASHWMLKPHT